MLAATTPTWLLPAFGVRHAGACTRASNIIDGQAIPAAVAGGSVLRRTGLGTLVGGEGVEYGGLRSGFRKCEPINRRVEP